jgi:CyaY protein
MTETEFLNHVGQVWQDVESLVDDWSEQHDVAAQRAGPVLEIEFESGQKIIINPQTPMQQIWLASPFGAFHFSYREAAWRDTRKDTDFWQVLRAQAALLGVA